MAVETTMEPPWPGARIFLSSGQTEGTPEADLVIDVQHKLEDLGFEVTIATGTTVPRGVWPEIFSRLRESEYFILIDFRRRGLPGRPLPDGWNRSLVSHQELAVALSHETPFLAFTEEGMLGRVGALRMVPSATIQFKRSNLVQKVQEAVSSAIWRPDWRNELQLTRTTRDSDNQDWVRFGPGPTYLGAKYYQIGVRNANGTTLATDVHAFLESWSGGPSKTPDCPFAPAGIEVGRCRAQNRLHSGGYHSPILCDHSVQARTGCRPAWGQLSADRLQCLPRGVPLHTHREVPYEFRGLLSGVRPRPSNL